MLQNLVDHSRGILAVRSRGRARVALAVERMVCKKREYKGGPARFCCLLYILMHRVCIGCGFRQIGTDFTSCSSSSGDDDFLDHALCKLYFGNSVARRSACQPTFKLELVSGKCEIPSELPTQGWPASDGPTSLIALLTQERAIVGPSLNVFRAKFGIRRIEFRDR